jgi:hypothetical protein
LSAELDDLIYDFLEQLRRATELGWYRTKPDHYRAILAALESALRQRQELPAVPASAAPNQPTPEGAEPQRIEAMIPVALRWSLLPLLAFVPSRSQ